MKPADIELFHVLGKPTISPDGRFAVVAVTRPDLDCDEYRGHLWIVPTDGSAQPRPFTSGWRDSAPAYSPDGEWLAFLRAGGEGGQGNATKPQLYVMPTAGGEPRSVTDHPLGAGAPVWSPDSGKIAYLARVPDEGRYGGKPDAEPPRQITTLQFREDGLGFFIDRRSHVFVVEPFGADDPQPVQVTSGDFDHHDVAWSHDGQHLAFVSARHDTRDTDLVSDVWLCALDGSQLRPVTRGGTGEGPRLSINSVRVAPDGATICLAATEFGADGLMTTGGNAGVWSVPADGSAPPARLTDAETIHLALDTSIEATPDGVLACVERRGAVESVLVPYKNNDHQVENFAAVIASSKASPGPSPCWSPSRPIPPPEANSSPSISPEEPNASSPRWPRSRRGRWRKSRPPRLTAIRCTAGYSPQGEGPHPVLLMIHGGPHTQFGLRLHDETQVYVGAGYAVIMGNPRGSSGYGETHGKWVAGDAAGPAAADLLSLLDAGLATGGLDSSRVGVLGGSYGGYMTTWLSAIQIDSRPRSANAR